MVSEVGYHYNLDSEFATQTNDIRVHDPLYCTIIDDDWVEVRGPVRKRQGRVFTLAA